DAARDERADPVLVGRTERLRAVGMEVVGDRAGHEFDHWERERPAGMGIVPTRVEGHMTQGKSGGKGRGAVVEMSVVAVAGDDFPRVRDPDVTVAIGRIRYGA